MGQHVCSRQANVEGGASLRLLLLSTVNFYRLVYFTSPRPRDGIPVSLPAPLDFLRCLYRSALYGTGPKNHQPRQIRTYLGTYATALPTPTRLPILQDVLLKNAFLMDGNIPTAARPNHRTSTPLVRVVPAARTALQDRLTE